MKRAIFLFAICICFGSVSLEAQKFFNVKKFGVEVGFDQDMVQGLSGTGILGKTSTEFQERYSLVTEENGTKITGVCENPNLRAVVVLEPIFWKNTELQVSGNFIWNRWDGVSYYSGNYEEGYNYSNVDMYGSEVALEAVLVKKYSPKHWFHLYGGGGLNSGYHFGNTVYVSNYGEGDPNPQEERTFADVFAGSEPQYAPDYARDWGYEEISDGFSTRAFAVGGFGVTMFKRLELGVNIRYGLGLRTFNGADNDFTNLRSIGTTMKWTLK